MAHRWITETGQVLDFFVDDEDEVEKFEKRREKRKKEEKGKN